MSAQSLATRAVRGVFWTGSPFILQIAISMIFYGYLDAAAMGQFEGALILVMFLALLTPLGLDQALIQRPEVDEVHYSSSFWLSLAVGLAGAVLVAATAPWSARLSGVTDVATFRNILAVLSLILPFSSVSGLLRSRLQRELRFRPVALAEILSVVVYTLAAAVLLYREWGIMSPVVSAVVREVALCLGLAWGAAWRPRLMLRPAAIRDLLSFGLNFTGSRGVNYLNSNLPAILIFPLLGEAAMGYFRFAYRLTLMPLVRVSTVITRVVFPTFATIQDDTELLRRGYLRTVDAIALSFWPALAAVYALAPQGIALLQQLNGQELEPALLPVRLLALATVVKAVGTPVGSVFLARGKASWSLYWSLFSSALLVPALYWSAAHGVEGICAVTAATSLIFLVLSQLLANRLLDLRFGAYLATLVRPGLVAVTLALVLIAARPLLPAAPAAACAAGTALALVAFAAAARLFAWGQLRALWRDLRGRAPAGLAPGAGA
ncbi:MAG: lipopolysaccharide biosynthesis protein [Gemmatimonadota bacterium]